MSLEGIRLINFPRGDYSELADKKEVSASQNGELARNSSKELSSLLRES